MCWSGAQTELSHCSLYHLAGRRASMSLLVLQHFISGFRGSDECLIASRAKAPCNLVERFQHSNHMGPLQFSHFGVRSATARTRIMESVI